MLFGLLLLAFRPFVKEGCFASSWRRSIEAHQDPALTLSSDKLRKISLSMKNPAAWLPEEQRQEITTRPMPYAFCGNIGQHAEGTVVFSERFAFSDVSVKNQAYGGAHCLHVGSLNQTT